MNALIVELKLGIATTTIEVLPNSVEWTLAVDLLVQMNAYASSKASALTPGPIAHQQQQQQGRNTEDFAVTSIEVTENNGVKAVRVRGGAWTKFGVPLYSDTCRLPDDVRALLMSVPFGELQPPRDLTAVVLMRDGKPVKVLEIT